MQLQGGGTNRLFLEIMGGRCGTDCLSLDTLNYHNYKYTQLLRNKQTITPDNMAELEDKYTIRERAEGTAKIMVTGIDRERWRETAREIEGERGQEGERERERGEVGERERGEGDKERGGGRERRKEGRRERERETAREIEEERERETAREI